MAFDRNWMVIDAASGQFLTQRELPRYSSEDASFSMQVVVSWRYCKLKGVLGLQDGTGDHKLAS